MDKVLLLASAGVGFYLYQNPDLLEQLQQQLAGDGSMSVPYITPTEGTCPEGYVISTDGLECLPLSGNPCGDGFTLSEDGSMCDPTNPCKPGFIISVSGAECLPEGSDPCGKGFKMNKEKEECEFDGNPCGDKCYKLNEDTLDCDKIHGCGTATGEEWGDLLLYTGESIILGEIYDRLGRKIGSALERRAQQKAEREVAKKVAQESAKKLQEAVAKRAEKELADLAVRRLAQETAMKAVQNQAQRTATEQLGKRTAGILAKQAEKNIATIAMKKLATKVATMVAKIGALSSTGIGALLTPLSVVALSLSIGLTASGTRFEKDSPNDKEWNDVPEGARVAIEALPGVGDIISIMGNFIAFRDGCPPPLIEQNSLCYEPPKEGFDCEAFLCYAKTSAYPGGFSPLSETFAHMTKRILTDTGTIPNRCPDGMVHGVESTDQAPGFCYVKPDYGSHGATIVLGTAWEGCEPGMTDTGIRCEDVYGGGVGRARDCPAGWNATPLTCEEPIGSSIDPCPDGSRDVAGTCWGVCENCVGGCHGDCGCHWSIGTCWPNCCGCAWKSRTDCVKKNLGERNLRTWGGNIKGRGAGSDLPCPAGTSPGWDGLCYEECRPGYRREGLLCTRSYTKRSQVLDPKPNLCPDGKTNISDLCYSDDAHIPAGYRRKTLGLLDQDCPQDKEEWKSYPMFNGTVDIGVSCQRATYTRPPFPKISIYGMRKVEPPPDPPPEPLPPLCSTLPPIPNMAEGMHGNRLCRSTDTPAEFNITEDGLHFYRKCRELFNFNVLTKECEQIESDGKVSVYDNSAGFEEVQYDYR